MQKIMTHFLQSEKKLALIMIALATILRAFWIPSGDLPLQSDELGYLSDGLLIAEGILPSYSFAPAAWPALPAALAAFAAIAVEVISALSSDGDLAVGSITAVDAALFNLYADMTGLRLGVGLAGLPLVLLGVWCATIFGNRIAGISGALICGGSLAVLPLFVELALQARPYATAWSLIAISTLAASSANQAWRSYGAGTLMGLAIACRIDAAIALPLIVLVQAWSKLERNVAREIWQTLLGAILGFLLAAPWYVLTLLGNLRTLLTVRVLNAPALSDASVLQPLLEEGLIGAVALIAAGFMVSVHKRPAWWLPCGLYLVVLAALIAKPSGFGLRHQGSIVTVLLLLGPMALVAISSALSGRTARIVLLTMAFAVTAPPAFAAMMRTFDQLGSRRPDGSAAWIEENVPSGTAVYLTPSLRMPLPTAESADRLWRAVAEPAAWERKLQQGGARFGISQWQLPRAMSDRHVALDRGNRRRLFILGNEAHAVQSRYDLKIISGGGVFDLTFDQALAEFCRSGGVLVIDGYLPPLLGKPDISWSGKNLNSALYVFRRDAGQCTP